MTVILYTQPGCGPCVAQARALTKHGIAFETVNIRETPEAADRIAALGATSTPVVEVATPLGSWHWAGFNLDKTKHLQQLQNGQ